MKNSQKTVSEIVKFFKKELSGMYPEREIQSIIYIVFEEVMGFSKVDVYAKSEVIPNAEYMEKLAEVFEQLKNYKPIQYIFGKTEFYNLQFFITPGVLIPRQETQELADWIIHENNTHLKKIIDIGTGSGCLAITLNKNIFRSIVDACDISDEAIALAEENALNINAKIKFYKVDILKWQDYDFFQEYDLIVSNPPYVRESEKVFMLPNVLNYEPHQALFVSDEDPLIYYRAICDFAQKHLKPRGKMYFEVNEALFMDCKILFLEKGFSNVEIKKDINGKFRMMSACRG